MLDCPFFAPTIKVTHFPLLTRMACWRAPSAASTPAASSVSADDEVLGDDDEGFVVLGTDTLMELERLHEDPAAFHTGDDGITHVSRIVIIRRHSSDQSMSSQSIGRDVSRNSASLAACCVGKAMSLRQGVWPAHQARQLPEVPCVAVCRAIT